MKNLCTSQHWTNTTTKRRPRLSSFAYPTYSVVFLFYKKRNKKLNVFIVVRFCVVIFYSVFLIIGVKRCAFSVLCCCVHSTYNPRTLCTISKVIHCAYGRELLSSNSLRGEHMVEYHRGDVQRVYMVKHLQQQHNTDKIINKYHLLENITVVMRLFVDAVGRWKNMRHPPLYF